MIVVLVGSHELNVLSTQPLDTSITPLVPPTKSGENISFVVATATSSLKVVCASIKTASVEEAVPIFNVPLPVPLIRLQVVPE